MLGVVCGVTIWRLSSMFGAEPMHDLPRTFLPLDLRGYYFISQGALAQH